MLLHHVDRNWWFICFVRFILKSFVLTWADIHYAEAVDKIILDAAGSTVIRLTELTVKGDPAVNTMRPLIQVRALELYILRML